MTPAGEIRKLEAEQASLSRQLQDTEGQLEILKAVERKLTSKVIIPSALLALAIVALLWRGRK